MLTDFAAYPEWNSFVRCGEAEVRVGTRLHVYIEPSGGKEMSFRPTVLVADPNRELRWLGHLWVRGLFDGEHSFSIEPLAWMPTEGEPANHMAIDTITLSVVDSILPLDFKVIPISRGSTHAPSTLADLWT